MNSHHSTLPRRCSSVNDRVGDPPCTSFSDTKMIVQYGHGRCRFIAKTFLNLSNGNPWFGPVIFSRCLDVCNPNNSRWVTAHQHHQTIRRTTLAVSFQEMKTTQPNSKAEDYHLLTRRVQVVIFRLRTGVVFREHFIRRQIYPTEGNSLPTLR